MKNRVAASIALSILGLLVGWAVALAESVWFADSSLEYVIRDSLDIWHGAIEDTDLLAISTIIARDKDISSLSGLEYCVSATFLDLGTNSVSDVSSIAPLTELTFLSLYQNSIADVEPLEGLVNLRSLWLDYNDLEDISPLAGLPKLVAVYLKSNRIADVSPLAGVTPIRILDLTYNEIRDISPLGGLVNLERCGSSGIRSRISPQCAICRRSSN